MVEEFLSIQGKGTSIYQPFLCPGPELESSQWMLTAHAPLPHSAPLPCPCFLHVTLLPFSLGKLKQ